MSGVYAADGSMNVNVTGGSITVDEVTVTDIEGPLGRAADAASLSVALSTEDVALLDGIEGSIDGIETLITSTNTKLDTVNTNLTTIDGRVDTLEAKQTGPTTGSITSVSDTNADGTILASNANRKGASFYNDSTAILYLALANVTSSSTVFTVQIPAGGYYELPVCQGGVYTGIVKGIWASDASGAVRVTELT